MATSFATAPSYDLSALQTFLAQQDSTSTSTSTTSAAAEPQVMVADDTDETAGMSFSELFSHYLAPEVAKLPPSSAIASTSIDDPLSASGLGVPPFADSAFTFGASTSSDNLAPFDPSTFMPTIPGSPISPSETGSMSHSAASPMSFADFEEMFAHSSTSSLSAGVAASASDVETDAFAIDPSIFDHPAATASSASTTSLSLSPEQAFSHATQLATIVEPTSLTSAVLPPLPSLPLPIPTAYDLPVPPPPAHSTAGPAVSASGRPKRHASVPAIAEEDEDDHDNRHDDDDDDDDSDMSDASEVTTRSTAAVTASTGRRSKRPAAKKARRSSSSASASAAAAANAAAEAKKLPKTSVAPLASDTLHKTSAKSQLPPVPLWKDKPDGEEYSKLSSKEKRQLRNKISARNFRHRRKEYITTLEEEISTRDTLISDLQDEVGTLRTDNTSLRSEVALLKDKWQELLDKMSSLAGSTPAPSTATAGLGVNPSRAIATASSSGSVQIKEEEPWALDSPQSSASPLPDTSAPAVASTSTAPRRIGTRGSNGIQRPNLSKDVAPSTIGRRSTGSWATQAGSFGGAGGFMPVHTTLVPDFATLASNLTHKSPFAAQSFNPNLNNLTTQQLDELPSLTSHLRAPLSNANAASPTSQAQSSSSSAFQDLFSTNPFYLNHAALEQQRAGLYSRIAHNAAGLAQAKKAAPTSADDAALPVPTGFRPAFFSTASGSSLPAPTKSLDKSTGPSSSTTRELLEFQSPSFDSTTTSHQDAYQMRLATMASQTLLSKMTNAFVAAFSGSSSASSSSLVAGGSSSSSAKASHGWDGSKVAAIVSGRAKLEVVAVDAAEVSAVDDLESKLASLSMSGATTDRARSIRSRSVSPTSSSLNSSVRRNCSFDDVVNTWTTTTTLPRAANDK